MTPDERGEQMEPAELRALYDATLREGEMASADRVERVGPVLMGWYGGERGFVTYRDLGGLDAAGIGDLVAQVVQRYRADPQIEQIEWKTRGHDDAPGLDEALRAHGLLPQEPEVVMLGAAAALVDAPDPPDGVSIRQVTREGDVRAAVRCAAEVFASPPREAERIEAEIVGRVRSGRGNLEMWVAETDGVVVCSGRLEPVLGSSVAGVWGGATLPTWRYRGIYRALTAARARSALAQGIRWIHSDSTPASRPVLERSGLVAVTTTTPYEWRRG